MENDQLDDEYYGGRDIDAHLKNVDVEDIVIRMENIHKTYLLGIEGIPALRGVSLSIKRGEFIIVFGLSGGGKTTLLNIAGTIDKPTKGELYLCGHRIDSQTTDEVLSYLRLKKLGFVFQTFNLLSSLSAQENVQLPMVLSGEFNAVERNGRALDLLTKVGMEKRLDHTPSQLSGGEQQRVTIARAVANNPAILLLDEPTGDLDSLNTCIVMKELVTLNVERKITLMMVTHDVGLKDFADRVIWMRDGKIKHVEVTSNEAKQQRLKQLDEEMESILKGKNKNREPFQSTFIRKPTDYETNPNFSVPSVSMFNFSEEFKTSNMNKSKEDISSIELMINEGRKESVDQTSSDGDSSLEKLSAKLNSVIIV
jgi:putative ABC transport system ATP-binding protein